MERTSVLRNTLLLEGGVCSIPFHSIPILQEVVGDDTLALQSVLECDEEREKLLKREREMLAKSSADGV